MNKRDIIDQALQNPRAALHHIERIKCEESLYEFVKAAWKELHPPSEPFTEGWAVQAMCAHLEAVTRGDIDKLLINIPPGCTKSMIVNVFWPLWEWGPKGRPHEKYISAGYNQDLPIRDLGHARDIMRSEWFQSHWPLQNKKDSDSKESYKNTKKGWRKAVGVGGGLTGWRGTRFIIDDPHSTKTAESDIERATARNWFLETVPTRFNNPRKPVYVIIMQRLNVTDLSGTVIEKLFDKQGWTHLCLPMRAEPKFASWTTVDNGTTPARMRRVKEDAEPIPYFVPDDGGELLYCQDPRTEEGELLWPERFPEEAVQDLEASFEAEGGGFAVACNPKEAPILMGDLSTKPIEDVRPGDVVAGFETTNRTVGTRARVIAVNKRPAQVVRITFESGTQIRCTEDHRWFKRAGRDYSPADVGSVLRRVVPAHLPELTHEQQIDAAWLAGFFDADGTCSNQGGPGRSRAGTVIGFTQSYTKNLPLCEKLERVLTSLGFRWTFWENQGVRQYSLLDTGPEMLHRFLSYVPVTKWRDRITDGAYRAKFFRAGKERVVSIEPDGEEDVYALQTSTGNYVAWGLGSSNCQLQQRPVPRAGGMFRRDAVNFVDHIPKDGLWCRGWDLAASRDGHAAYTVGLKMCISRGDIYITDVIRFRGSAGEVMDAIKSAAEQDGYDCTQDLPQDPGQAGKAQKAAIAKMLHGYDFCFTPESGTKEDRARPLAAQVEAGNVYVVRAPWNDDFMGELALFPGSQFKDQIDAASRAYTNLLKDVTDVAAVAPKLIS